MKVLGLEIKKEHKDIIMVNIVTDIGLDSKVLTIKEHVFRTMVKEKQQYGKQCYILVVVVNTKPISY